MWASRSQGSVTFRHLFLDNVWIFRDIYDQTALVRKISEQIFRFVSDFTILFSGDNWDMVPNDRVGGLNETLKWLHWNKLSLNIAKTHSIYFDTVKNRLILENVIKILLDSCIHYTCSNTREEQQALVTIFTNYFISNDMSFTKMHHQFRRCYWENKSKFPNFYNSNAIRYEINY